MQNLKFPESWEQSKSEAIKGFIQGTAVSGYRFLSSCTSSAISDYYEAARIMAESYEKRIAELEKELRNPYPDTEADGWVFCGKCGHQK